LAATQFDQARRLDANDPTPWFYDAILKDSQSHPAAALDSFETSAGLNGDRAVYRSRQLLDQDLAARGASQASVYNELGFHQAGLNQATQSLAADPSSSSAHRFLADINSTVPRYGIARASELLQAQLRQPLGAPPLQPQLANDVLFQNAFFGPATVGLNEFNPLFIRDGIRTQVFGLFGNNDTWGDQLIVSGLNGPVSFSVSQFAADTDGIRVNDDDSIRQYDGYLQWQVADGTSLQAEVTDWSRESGDRVSAFDPAFISDTLRNEEDVETQRLGMRHVISASSDILVSIIRQDRHTSLAFPDPVSPFSLVSDQESWKVETQYVASIDAFDVIFGASYFDGNGKETVIAPPIEDATPNDPNHLNLYGYLLYAPRSDRPQLQFGVSYDELNSDVGSQSELNPKLGVIWRLSDVMTLRAAGFRSLKRRINSDQGLEPTQIAGFNQLFDDSNGAVSEGGGLALDLTFSARAFAGIQLTRRNVKAPFDLGGGVIFEDEREDVASAYAYWLLDERLSVTLEARYQDFEHGAAFDDMVLKEIPISVKYASPTGIWAGLTLTGVTESGSFVGPGGVLAPGSDSFWVTDALVAYRVPQRRGTVSIEGMNIFGEKFRYQEPSQGAVARYVPEAQYLLRFTLSF